MGDPDFTTLAMLSSLGAKVGAARLLGRVCGLRLGANSAPTASTASSVAGRKVNLNQVLSQVDESEVELLNEAEVLAMHARYETFLAATLSMVLIGHSLSANSNFRAWS